MTFKPEGDVVEFNISVSVTNDNLTWAAVGFSIDVDMVMVYGNFFHGVVVLKFLFIGVNENVKAIICLLSVEVSRRL